MTYLRLGDVRVTRAGSVNPAKHPDETFDLYSIPAYDEGQPESVAGSEIGSSKNAVLPDDVLLSRIVPHIRRAWVVGDRNGHRQIASGEWLIFRSPDVDSRYLRWMLVSDPFHAGFMQTVAGVGGSLLRARPALVDDLQIPLPPLPEQKRIAAILDAADALRAKRRESLELLDKLVQSVFLDMFGDPVTNPKGWETGPIEKWFDVARGGSPRPIQNYLTDTHDGVNWIMIGDAEDDSRYIQRTAKKIKPEGVRKSRLNRPGFSGGLSP